MALLVVTGPPGAGKSTVARIVADRFEPSVLIEGDAFFAFLARRAIPPWLPEANRQNTIVTEAAGSAAGHFASAGYFTVYDGVIGPWFLRTFAAAGDLPCFDYVILLPSVERCVHQVARREGHGFSDEAATRKMHHEFTRAEIEQRHVLVDPPHEPEAVADLVTAAVSRGSLRYRSARP
jgi:cytidylate kinase